MGLEIERKFLVINDNWKEFAEASSHLKQGYLASAKNATIRVRIEDDIATVNIKGATVGITRHEYEYPIPLGDAKELMERLIAGSAIEKRRYKVTYAEHLWEIDVFTGENEGLVLAELELTSDTEEFDRPDWIGDEVSGEERYYNASLSIKPYSSW